MAGTREMHSNGARQVQLERYPGTRVFCNAQMGARELHTHCQVEAAGERLLELAISRLGLSARAYTRIPKVGGPAPTSTAAAQSRRAT